jgi:hypothetical protein
MSIIDQILSLKINGIRIIRSDATSELIQIIDLEGNPIGLGWIMENDDFNDKKLHHENIIAAQTKYLDSQFFVFFICENQIKLSCINHIILAIDNLAFDSFIKTIKENISSKNKNHFDSFNRYKEHHQLNQNKINDVKKSIEEKQRRLSDIKKEISELSEELESLESKDTKTELTKFEKIINDIILDRLTDLQKESIRKKIGHYKSIYTENNEIKIILRYYPRRASDFKQEEYSNDDGVPKWALEKVYGPNPWAQAKDFTYIEIDQNGNDNILYNGESMESSLNDDKIDSLFNLNYYSLKLK